RNPGPSLLCRAGSTGIWPLLYQRDGRAEAEPPEFALDGAGGGPAGRDAAPGCRGGAPRPRGDGDGGRGDLRRPVRRRTALRPGGGGPDVPGAVFARRRHALAQRRRMHVPSPDKPARLWTIANGLSAARLLAAFPLAAM